MAVVSRKVIKLTAKTVEEEENLQREETEEAAAHNNKNKSVMRVLELYSGIGGMHYALKGKRLWRLTPSVVLDSFPRLLGLRSD